MTAGDDDGYRRTITAADLLANDSDAEGDALQVIIRANPSTGR